MEVGAQLGAARGARAPWRRGGWSADEVASVLQSRRAEMRRGLARRRDARGVSVTAREEIVDEAICAVVMMRRPIVSEEHLMGAFWIAVSRLLCHHHEGRRQLRVGSQTQAELETVLDTLATGDAGPEERAEMFERMAQAADLMVRLDDFERRVVVAMAVRGAGLRLTARLLGVSVARVRAAVRSADEKLQQSAAIAAAGRMCGYRTSAITAQAEGVASEEQLRAARAHLAACTSCRRSYVLLVREMRSDGFQRRAAAAFLPVPLLAAAHHVVVLRRALDRLALPEGLRDRAVEALGGAGIVKVAAAGGAVVAATTTIAVSVHHAIEHPKARSGHPPAAARVARSARRRGTAHVTASPIWDARTSTAVTTRRRRPRKRSLPAAYREFSFDGARASRAGTRGSPAPRPVAPRRYDPAAHEFGFEGTVRAR
jgi:DNA-directed RNA polymerase specialized sigma24 family protein